MRAVRRRKGMCVVWPIYFDASASRELRRVRRSLAIPSPTLEELSLIHISEPTRPY